MIVPRHIDPEGLKVENLDVCIPVVVAPYVASAAGNIFTTQTFASALNTTYDFGTQIDFPRNIQYRISVTGGTASNPFVSGSIVVRGSDARGSAISEVVALSALGASSVASQGVVKFNKLIGTGAISISNALMHTASSTNSNSVTLSMGMGNVIGLPNPVGSLNPVKAIYEGTSQFTNYTFVSGPVGTAGVSVTPTLGSGSNLVVVVQLNGQDFRG
jgi:hypothetical protein